MYVVCTYISSLLIPVTMNFALIFSISSDVSFLYSFIINSPSVPGLTNPESIYNFKTTPLNVDLFSSGIM